MTNAEMLRFDFAAGACMMTASHSRLLRVGNRMLRR